MSQEGQWKAGKAFQQSAEGCLAAEVESAFPADPNRLHHELPDDQLAKHLSRLWEMAAERT